MKVVDEVRVNCEVAVCGLDPDAVLFHRPVVRAQRKQDNVLIVTRQVRSQVGSNGAGAGNEEPHSLPPPTAAATARL